MLGACINTTMVLRELVILIAEPIGQNDGEVLVKGDILYKLLE